VILVTGSGGKSGLALIRALRVAGAPARALVHREASVEKARAAGADQTVVGDVEDQATLLASLSGVDAVYALFPNMAPDELGMAVRLIEAAQGQGISRLVYHSVLHPQTKAMPHHWQKLHVEELLFESGLDFTILQPAAYMQNLKGYWDEAVAKGIYRVPYPVDTRLSLVDLQDVAEAAAIVLTQDGHAGATYELSGPEALTQDQIARALSQSIGVHVEARGMTVEAWLSRPEAQALGPHQRQSLAAMFGYYAAYGMVGNPNVLTWLLGRPPTGLHEVLRRDFSLSS